MNKEIPTNDALLIDIEEDLAWEIEMNDEWQMNSVSWMCDELMAQEADSGVAS